MKRPLAGAAAAMFAAAVAFAGLAVSPASAAPASAQQKAPHKQATPGFAGTVALSNCSGSLVKMPESEPGDPALILSNGHCLLEGMPGPGEVVQDKPSNRSFTLLKNDGSNAGKVTATKISYATMTDTDVSLYQLDSTYQQIEKKFGIRALSVPDTHPVKKKAITVVSGYWKEKYSCGLDDFVYRLKEDHWTWKDSLRYTSACKTKGGTSGSPVIDDATGTVVGVNNTRNESGERCTLDNPCEVDKQGRVTVRNGIGYGQETYILARCVGDGNKVDLKRPGCVLPRPKS
ncbi:serine protease [Streptomyces sp. ODS28]|uniref:serine protease n=1 Tax=Streptomyces sp. ODS28 TaxID=3136688 RepID=UPI0031E52E7A